MTTAYFDGYSAFITGAGSGIGRATALLLASRGAAVAVNDINPDNVSQTVATIQASGGNAVAAVADVADRAAVAAAIENATRQIGTITILVNNAGISSQRLQMHEIDDAILDRMLAVHVKGAFYCTGAVLEGMKAQHSGRIINISSAMGTVGGVRGSHYAAAKGALLAMTKTWAREFAAWNIRVNAIAPGGVFTNATAGIKNYATEAKRRVPMGRFGQPEEIASVVAFLASAEASYVTGQTLSPNGGEFMG